jgi:8-oxo-dGTP diphosphatase
MFQLTTLCYIRRGREYLMLHRTKKKNDLNSGKWIGIGGHFEAGESPEDCLLREVREETGLMLTAWQFRGIVTFCSDCAPTEYMHLFTADCPDGEVQCCDEGDLRWVDMDLLHTLPMWEGDRIFFDLIAREHPFFSLKLIYHGDQLTGAVLDGQKMLST